MSVTMDSTSTIGIIIPTYNRAHLLGRAIASVLRQTYENWELVVVDDGSTDNTEQVVRGYDDPRIQYLRTEKNGGAAAARNFGIETSQAPYLAFMDSDDEWMPEKLEKQFSVFQTSDLDQIGVVVCGCHVILERGHRIAIPSRRGWVHEDLLALRHNLSNINMLIKRSVTNSQLWFDETLRSSEEWDLQIRLSTISQFDYVAECLVIKYETEPDRIFIGENIPIGHVEVIKRHIEEFEAVPHILARHWAAISFYFMQVGQWAQARKAIRNAIKIRPWLVRYYLYHALSLMRAQRIIRLLPLRGRYQSLGDNEDL